MAEDIDSPTETERRLKRAITPWNRVDPKRKELNTSSRTIYETQLEFDHKDMTEPKLVVSLKNMIIETASAGAAHTAAVNTMGEVSFAFYSFQYKIK